MAASSNLAIITRKGVQLMTNIHLFCKTESAFHECALPVLNKECILCLAGIWLPLFFYDMKSQLHEELSPLQSALILTLRPSYERIFKYELFKKFILYEPISTSMSSARIKIDLNIPSFRVNFFFADNFSA